MKIDYRCIITDYRGLIAPHPGASLDVSEVQNSDMGVSQCAAGTVLGDDPNRARQCETPTWVIPAVSKPTKAGEFAVGFCLVKSSEMWASDVEIVSTKTLYEARVRGIRYALECIPFRDVRIVVESGLVYTLNSDLEKWEANSWRKTNGSVVAAVEDWREIWRQGRIRSVRGHHKGEYLPSSIREAIRDAARLVREYSPQPERIILRRAPKFQQRKAGRHTK